MKTGNSSRFLALLMAMIMVFSMIPMSAFAVEGSAVYTKISTAAELTTGKYVIVVSGGYAMGVFDSATSWITAEAVTEPEDGKLTDPAAGIVWTVTVDGSTAKLTDSNGTTIKPKAANKNGIASGDYSWNVTCANGTFQFDGQASDGVRLAANKSSGYKFRAYKTATASGYPCNFTLYKLEGGTQPVEPTTEPTTVPTVPEETTAPTVPAGVSLDKMTALPNAGDTIVIYNPANTVAMGSAASGSKIAAVTAALSDGKLPLSDDMAKLVVGVESDGSYTFTLDGKYLTSGETGNSMSFADALTDCGKWTFEADTAEGVYYIRNVGAAYNGNHNQAMEYYKGFTTYGIQTGKPAFQMELYLVSAAVPTYDYAKKLSELKQDDKVIIYHDASGNVMLSTASGKKLAGEAAEPVEDFIKLTENMAVLTVSVDANGHYSFVSADGKYLTSGATGNSLTLADAPSDYSLWDPSPVTGGFKVMNTNAAYNNNKNQALEYYNGFTVYGFKENNDAYIFNFYGLTTEKPSAPAQVKTPEIAPSSTLVSTDTVEITLSCETAGAAIYYTTDGSDPTAASTQYTAPFTLTLTDGSATVKAIAVKDGMTDSEIASKTYTKLDPNQDFVQITSADQLLGGGNFVIVPKEYPTWALSTSFAYKPSAVEVTMANGSYAPVFNVQPMDGGVSIQYVTTGKYIGYDSNYSTSFQSADAAYKFDVVDNGDGSFRLIFSTATNRCITFRSNDHLFGAYAKSNDGKTDQNGYGPYECDMLIYLSTDGYLLNPTVSFGVLNNADKGQDYTASYEFSETTNVSNVKVTYSIDGGEAKEAVLDEANQSFTIPGSEVKGALMTLTVTATDTNGDKVKTISATADVTVKDEPKITSVTPANNAQTGEDKTPTISVKLVNADVFTAKITITDVNGKAIVTDGAMTVSGDTASYVPAAAMEDGRYTVTVTVERQDGKIATKTWAFTVGSANYTKYFGQLHSHTGEYSDGAGTLDSALNYIAGLPASANVDFVAFTDHSNYFDSSSAANPEDALYDKTLMTADSLAKWNAYNSACQAFNESHSDVIALPGFEMTWSGGPGHINTFNTPGLVSRNNKTLNNKNNDAGMKAYYALLSKAEGTDGISQFNHPGTTFGNFTDFSYWDALIDSRMYLVEVGNGEGQIGAGGYYPSYEQYTMALDKGWHVAPTNNQDNHKGAWGNGNDARDVILAEALTVDALYDAIRAYRVYSTEDKNLSIDYSINGMIMGSIIPSEEMPEKLNISVNVSDPDAADKIAKVEVIVNSGKVAYTWDDAAQLAQGSLSCTLDPDYSYYYIRVTEEDDDLAVTAPIWVGDTLKVGISSVNSTAATPVTGEELTINTTLFNSESKKATVKSLTYTTDGSVVLGVDTTGYTIPASGTVEIPFAYTPTTAKVMTITVTAVVEVSGKEYTFSMDLKLDVTDADKVIYVAIDGSHHNEYVAGNYKDSMGNYSQLAAGYSVRVVILNTHEDFMNACANENGKYKMIIMTVPSRRDGTDLRKPYDCYTDEEIKAITDFNKAGGAIVLAGWSDYYEKYEKFPAEDHMAAQQNKILAALGSSLRIGDDATNDDVLNGGQSQRLYFSSYNWNSFLMKDVEFDPEHPNDNLYSEVFSQYGGASVYIVDENGNATASVPSTVTPVVFGHESTYVKDSDEDGLGASVQKYPYAEGDDRIMVLATEERKGQGLIVVSGAAFMSNFEVQMTLDNSQEKNYSNYTICENLLQYINPITVTDIAEVQAQTEKDLKFTIEGIVTSNASGYDKDTAFFDCIYVQDATGGVCCFPVAGEYKIGDKVRITGTTDFYQGEMELQVMSIELLSEGNEVTPKEVTAAQVNDRSVMGQLITVKGTVVSYELAEGLVQTIMVKDANGDIVRVFIDGYITKAEDVKNLSVGCGITVTGLASYDDTFNAPEGPFPRIRIRNRADIICTEAPAPEYAFIDNTGDQKIESGSALEVHVNGDAQKIQGVYVNGVLVDSKYYTAEGENAVIVLSKEYLANLAAGTYSLRVVFADGAVETTFTISAAAVEPTDPKPTEPEPTEPKPDTPHTGDDAHVMLWVLLLAVSAAAIVVLVLLGKRKTAKK